MATHYVADDGTATWAQSTNINTPCSMGTANTNADAGDTVYLRVGNYATGIVPSNDGSSGNRIVFEQYQAEVVNITATTVIDLRNRNYITVDGMTKDGNIVSGGFVNMYHDSGTGNATYNIIQNCHFESVSAVWAGVYMRYGADHNQFLDNVFITSNDGSTDGIDDLLYMIRDCHYNLFEANTFTGGLHDCFDVNKTPRCTYTIFRNNVVSCLPHVGVNFTFLDHGILEGNTIKHCGNICDNDGDDESCNENVYGSASDKAANCDMHCGFQLYSSSNVIVRQNLIYGNMMGILGSSGTDYNTSGNRVYNNTIANNIYWGHKAENDGGEIDLNYWKNNIFYENHGSNPLGASATVNYFNSCAVGDLKNYFSYNDFYDSVHANDIKLTAYRDQDYMDTNHAYWSNNEDFDPNFVSPATAQGDDTVDYTLQSSSSAIDAGTYLTTITTATGSGTSFDVADATYFYDGSWFSGDTGDVIKTQNGQTATITDITGNTITVDSAISWTQNEGIALDYNDSAPDMGAYEADATKLALILA